MILNRNGKVTIDDQLYAMVLGVVHVKNIITAVENSIQGGPEKTEWDTSHNMWIQ